MVINLSIAVHPFLLSGIGTDNNDKLYYQKLVLSCTNQCLIDTCIKK